MLRSSPTTKPRARARPIRSASRPDDVLIVISKTGSSAALCEAAESARRNGASVIAITDGNSPLAGVASLCFACDAREDTNVYTPMSSRLVHLVILDALQVALALQLGETAAANLRRTKAALQQTL